jgi:hypothetical protein
VEEKKNKDSRSIAKQSDNKDKITSQK